MKRIVTPPERNTEVVLGRVTPTVKQWVATVTDAEGIPESTYVRNLILRDREQRTRKQITKRVARRNRHA